MGDMNIERLLGALEQGLKSLTSQFECYIKKFTDFIEKQIKINSDVENKLVGIDKERNSCNGKFAEIQNLDKSFEKRLRALEQFQQETTKKATAWDKYKAYIITGMVSVVLNTTIAFFLTKLFGKI